MLLNIYKNDFLNFGYSLDISTGQGAEFKNNTWYFDK